MTAEPVNVLLVDDTPANILAYEVMLADLGQNLLKAASAEEAFRVLLNNDVALVVTDVSMPTLNGFEFAKMLRAHPRFAATAIIFVSALALSELDFARLRERRAPLCDSAGSSGTFPVESQGVRRTLSQATGTRAVEA